MAQSWKKAHPDSDGVFFAKLDLTEGKPIFLRVPFLPYSYSVSYVSLEFNRLPMYGCILLLLDRYPNCLQIINPSFTIFLESASLLSHMTDASGMHADSFHKFLQSTIKLPPFPLVRPFDWQKAIAIASIYIMFGVVAWLAWSEVQKIITNKNAWAAASLVFSSTDNAKFRL